MFAHRWGNERKMHRNHPQNKVNNFLTSQAALLHTNTSVFVYLYGKEVWTTKISTTYWKRQKGWTGTVIKFHMVGDRQYSWDLSFTFSKSEFSSRKLAFADQHELNQWIGVTLSRRDSIFGFSALVLCLLGWRWSWRQGRSFLDGQMGLARGGAWPLPPVQGGSQDMGTDSQASGEWHRDCCGVEGHWAIWKQTWKQCSIGRVPLSCCFSV